MLDRLHTGNPARENHAKEVREDTLKIICLFTKKYNFETLCLFSVIGTTLKSMGVEFIDPMLAMRSSILGVNAKIKYLNNVFTTFSGIGNDDLKGRNFRQSSELGQGDRDAKLTNDLKYFFDKVFNFKGLGNNLEVIYKVNLKVSKKENRQLFLK